MVITLEGRKGLVFQALLKGLKEAHSVGDYKIAVEKTEDVKADFLNAVKEKYSAKFLDDADYLIKVAILRDGDNGETPPEEETKGEEPVPEKTKDGEEPVAESKKEDEEKKEPEGDTQEVTDLKQTIIDTVQRTLFIPETEKAEFFDLDNFKKEGYAVGFFKVSLGK